MRVTAWQKWLRRSARKDRHGGRRALNRRLDLEALESRLAPASFTWSGGGSDNLWSDAQNWVGGVAPQNGDSIIFDATGTGKPNSVNDSVSAITNLAFDAPGYDVSSGSAIGSLTINGSIYAQYDGSTMLESNLTTPSGGDLVVTVAGDTTALVLNGVIQSPLTGGFASGLDKEGSGALGLGGVNTYTGATTVGEGILQVEVANAIPATSDVKILTGATLDLNSHDDTTGSLAGNTGSSVLLGGATLTIGGDDASTTMSGVIGRLFSDTGGVTKVGQGTFTVAAVNTYTGPTAVQGGTFQVGVTNAISNQSAVSVANGAVLDLNSNDDAIGSLAGAVGSRVTLGTATLTTGNADTSTIFSGTISGSGGLTKTGTGTLELAAANSYTGNTTLNDGVLAVDDNGSLGRVGMLLLDGGELQSGNGLQLVSLANPFDVRGSAAVGGGNNLTLSGRGTLDATLLVDNSFGVTVTLAGGLIGGLTGGLIGGVTRGGAA